MAGVTALQGSALAKPKPKDVAVGTRLAAETNPAVQQIMMAYTATLTIPEPVATKAFEGLFAKAERHAKAGRIPADHQSQIKWVLRAAAKNVGKYLVPGKALRKDDGEVVAGICTGWWITPDGYMVTAAHCAGMSKAALRQEFATKALAKIAKRDVQDFIKGVSDVAQPDEGMTKLAEEMFTAFDLKAMRVRGLKKELAVVMHDGKGKISVRNLELVAKGSDWPGADFALLKMAGARGLPTVSLGSDDDVRVGDNLYISGFPGILSLNPDLDELSRLYPSVTEGAFNVRRTSVKGVPYLQAQAPMYVGNSGGPVFSADGRVIGMVVAAATMDSGLAENAGFVLPVGVIKKRLAAAAVEPRGSRTSRVYSAGLEDYFSGRYEAALDKFHLVRKLYPAHPYVGAFIADTKKALR
ncbi:trypsin-like peptidase domain-containing protein [Nonomuraea sp. bgisy101]|uniref:trypsin-like peptidase domain-containing protein n=1 Tax=Nonomuraea sp. bgisy101 TaxID=3413784 RepID=UPI003D75FF0E